MKLYYKKWESLLLLVKIDPVYQQHFGGMEEELEAIAVHYGDVRKLKMMVESTGGGIHNEDKDKTKWKGEEKTVS